jgi:excisionase family DNA binding protein
MTNIVQLDFNDLQTAIKDCLRDAIAEIKAIPEPQKIPDRCTLAEACEVTHLSKSAIYKLCMDGAIPFEKYGRRSIFSRKALNEWMTARTIQPATPDQIMTERLQKSAKKKA